MPTLEDAIALAADAHTGQTAKAGAPYVLYLLRVMQAQESAEARMAAVLHDLVEDTEYAFEDLGEMGYPGEVIEALRHVTKRDGEPYPDFAERAGQHPIARQVKIADLEDNMDVTRLGSVGQEDTERLDKYLRAHRRLTDGGERRSELRGCESLWRLKTAVLTRSPRNWIPEIKKGADRPGGLDLEYERQYFVWSPLLLEPHASRQLPWLR